MDFSKLIYWAQGVRKECAPPSVRAQPRSLAHPPPPLPCSPSPRAHPPSSFPLHAALPLACGIARAEGTGGARSLLRPPACRGGRRAGRGGTGRARKPEGATGAATRVERPTQRGRVSKWGSRGNGGGQRTFCTPCLCGKVG